MTDPHSAQIATWSRHLPVPGAERIAVRVTPDALRQVRGGSPWVYDGSITSASRDGASGDLAVVFDDKRRFAAIGLWDPGSPIRVKVLHRGAPRTIDSAFFVDAIARSVERRSTLAADPDTNAYRCVHGENDGLPGLVVDRYAGTVVAKIYTDAWWPHLASVVAAVDRVLTPERVVLRTARAVRPPSTHAPADGSTLIGDVPPAPVRFRERGLVMEADVVHGHKTGHFLDQRDNRALVRSL
ncbi:MAG TPA: class I SAM-dependent rRNA methyltransferase, partial [Ilumatobacteraceae bacterium]